MYKEIVVIGIIISLFFFELTAISPGGIIVPAYIALNLSNPKKLLITIIISIIAWLIMILVRKYFLMFGQRQYVFSILVAYLILLFLKIIVPYEVEVIGYLIPGIICHQILQQGLAKTSLALIIVTSIIALIMYFFNVPVFN